MAIAKDITEIPTTASFRITIGQKAWIEEESERRNIKQSDLIRKVLAQAIADADGRKPEPEAA